MQKTRNEGTQGHAMDFNAAYHLPSYKCHDHDQVAQGEDKPHDHKDLIDHKPAAKLSRL